MWGPNLLRGEVRCKGNSKFSKHNKLWAKFFSFLKKSNRNRHLIGGLLVGLCALSPWAAIYRGTGTSLCPEGQQGIIIYQDIGLSFFLFLDTIMSHISVIYYQNDSWIFATSTCNLENQNCTFWPFCAKNHWPTTQFLVHFIQSSLGRPTIRSVVDRP